MSHQRSTRVVFVGNIPYDYTEEQLIEVFKEVGPVVSFRLVFDRDTGKPRGYGFCEYQDAETAASAVRNLNSYEVGGRELRVDYADNEKDDGHERPAGQHEDNRKPFNRPNQGNTPQQQQQQPQGVQPSPPQSNQPQNNQNQNCVEAIQNVVNMLPQRELLELMSQMKSLIDTNPVTARNLLMINPQLSYAIFQALLTLNLVDPNIIQRILQVHLNESNSNIPPQSQPQPQSQPPQPNPVQNASMSPVQPPNPQIMNQNQNLNINQKPPQLPPQFNGDVLQEQQKQLLLQVLSLTQEQINSLTPEQRENVLALKAQIMGQNQNQA